MADLIHAFEPFLIGLILVGLMILILVIVFLISRYRKFLPNQFVILIRHGRTIRAATGGAVFLYPLIDSIQIIPTTVQQTFLEARERVVSYEYQDISVTALIFWRVSDPEVAFQKVSWDRSQVDYVERMIKNAAESIIRTTCANMPIERVIRERNEIIKEVSQELHSLMADWGITIESVEIRDVEVLDATLKANLEAVKKVDEDQKAKLREAEMEELTQLRNIEVERQTGIAHQATKLEVESAAKRREVQITELEQQRAIVEAETEKRQIEIRAEAERFRRVKQEIDVEVERMMREAEARKTQLIAEAEGAAEQVRQRLLAEAEGIREQAKAMAQADERFIQLKTLEILPEIYRGIKVDNMMLLGEGQDAYKSLAQLVLPFIQVVKQITDETKGVGSKKKKEKRKNELE